MPLGTSEQWRALSASDEGVDAIPEIRIAIANVEAMDLPALALAKSLAAFAR
jgi:hypothetical protein